MIEFIDDEDGYLAWLDQHPSGFVVNCERVVRPTYLVLHRATCRHISSPKRTNYTTGDFIKMCAEAVEELESWAAFEAGGTVSPCKWCGPMPTEPSRETLGVAVGVGQDFTQPVKEKDISNGRIRVPRAAKGLLPSDETTLAIELRGVRASCRWNPRLGPDKERSGVLSVPKSVLAEGVRPDERLRIRFHEGVVFLD